MTATIITILVVAGIAGYLWYGFRVIAPRYVNECMEEWTSKFDILSRDPDYVRRHRRFEAGMAIGPALVWPFWLLTQALTKSIEDAAPLTDHELRLQLQEKDQYIEKLEIETGIRKK